jgi:hypothetical protein
MSFYSFSVPSFHITEVRSAHSDTLFASTALKVTNPNGSLHLSFDAQGAALNDRKAGGGVDLPFLFRNVDVPSPTPENPDGGAVFWTFLLVNAGNADREYVVVLNKAADAFAGALAGKVIDKAAMGDIVASLEFLAGLGVVLGAQEALNLLTANCDGQVASGSFAFTARQLAEMVLPTATHDFSVPNPGSKSPAGCGANSQYEINYQITRNTEARIRELRLEKTGWAQADLTSIVTNSPPALQLETGSSILSLVAASDNIPRVYYIGVDDQVQELRLERSGWAQATISRIVNNNPPAFPIQIGTRLATFATPISTVLGKEQIPNPRFYYEGANQHIHELRLEANGWAQAEISTIVLNDPPAPLVRTGSPIAALVSREPVFRVFYISSDNNLNELRLESNGWFQANIASIVGNNPPAVSPRADTSLTAVVSPDGIPRVLYIGSDNKITELRLETGWLQASISNFVINNPPAFPPQEGTDIAAIVDDGGTTRVFYIGQDNQIRELRLERGAWVQASISASVTNSPPAFPPRARSPLAALLAPGSIPRVFYIGVDSHVHELRLERTGWLQADISDVVTNNAPAFPVESSSPLLAYLTSDQVVRLVYRG